MDEPAMRVEERALEAIEFPRILKMLAEHTTWSPGRRLALLLRPSSRRRTVDRWRQETREARQLVDRESVPMGGLRDILSHVRRVERGGIILPEDLLDVASTAVASARLRAFLIKRRDRYPALSAWGDLISDLGALGRRIDQCIDEEGRVRDRASARLASVRKRLAILSDRVRDRMESFLRGDARTYLQEAVITQRGGRYVVPVKREYRGRVHGLVHDQSGSGATLFIEPQAVVELNNARREAESEEKEEVERILRELASEVAESARDLKSNQGYLTRVDLALARAKLGSRMGAVTPVRDDRSLVLEDARHPLLGEGAVPTSLSLLDGCRILVLTGPNTGGKTVTLKTVGLMAVMAQVGMDIPARKATMPLFEQVFVDIGDEQGLEQNLSTFSSHMKNIIPVTAGAGDRSLVLLDEVGAGTDPLEGTALAMAVLEELCQRGAFALASTHYSELKSFAYLHPGLINASMEFDPDTLAPTYRLVMGMPGRSNAFEIARRLGLPQEVLARAAGHLGRENRRSEDMISQMQDSLREMDDLKRMAERDREEARKLKDRWQKAHRDLDERRASYLDQAREEAMGVVSTAREEARELVDRLRQMRAREGTEAVHPRQWENVRSEIAGLERRIRDRAQVIPQEDESHHTTGRKWVSGDHAYVRGLRQECVVLGGADDHGQVMIQVGQVRMRVDESDLTEPSGQYVPPARTKTVSAGGALGRAKATSMSHELHIRGLTVDEAVERVEKYLDDALLAGLERVRLIHGKGTGTLRRAVGEYLAGHPHVSGFETADPRDGGTGVTVVVFGPEGRR